MTNNRKKVGWIAAAVFVVFAAFLILYHVPRTFRWTGMAESHVNGIDMTSELEIDVRIWSKLFREPEFTGSVTVDGVRYEDLHIHSYLVNNPFVPVSLKENYAGNPSKVYDDYLYLHIERWTGNDMLTVYVRGGVTKEAPQGLIDRIFDIPVQ